MHTKLTLRLDEKVVKRAKQHAAQRGKSVSQMFGEYVASLSQESSKEELPPITRSFRGLLKNQDFSEEDYKRHLERKHR